MKKEKGKTKSEKVRTSLLLTFSLLLFTSAANAANLPEGYTAVEYIESTKGGGQFIDTGYTANGQTRVVFDAVIPVRSEQDDRFGVLFGSRTKNDWSKKAFALQMCTGNSETLDTVRFVYNGAYRQDDSKPFSFGGRVMVMCDGQHFEWTGSKAASVAFTADPLVSSKSTLYIFADNSVDGDDGEKDPKGTNHSIMRLYSFKITEGEAVKRDFVPCVRVNDWAVGLYDLAAEPSKAFYANCGTGTFGIPDDAICTVTIGDHPKMTASYTFGDGLMTNAIVGTSFQVVKGFTNVKVIFAAYPEYEAVGGELVHDIGTVNGDCAPEFSNLPQLVHRKVEYVDSDGQLQTNDTFTIVTAAMAQFSNGWYLVEGTVSRGGIDVASGCAANLILADGASLTVRGGGAGIDVQPGEALNIYGQRRGSGRLTASGGADAAGIGGASGKNCGEIIIAGGTVMATGGQRAAGIGGGAQSQGPTRGTIYIMGGYVEAKSASMGGSGIGSGRRFSQVGNDVPPIVISGGTVWASGSRYNETGQWGADLGRGLNNKGGGSVTIIGGSVLANRGYIEPDPTDGCQTNYCVTVEGLTSVESIEGLGSYGVRDISPINGKIYLYLPNGTYEFAVNGTKYDVTVNGKATTAKSRAVTPGVPVVCDTAEEATNLAMRAELTPSAEVAAALGSDEERQKYRNMFEFGVVPTADGKWAVEAFLKEPDWTNVVKSAQAATRQIPVADIAALKLGDPTNVSVEGCVPGFYYSLYSGTALTNVKAFASEKSYNVLCKPEEPVTFDEIVKPSDASGYFMIGVLEVPIVYVPGEQLTVTGKVPVIPGHQPIAN